MLAHLSPLTWEHIGLTRDYTWRPEHLPANGEYRRRTPQQREKADQDVDPALPYDFAQIVSLPQVGEVGEKMRWLPCFHGSHLQQLFYFLQ